MLFTKYWGLPGLSFSRWSVEAAAMDEWESRADLPKAEFDALLRLFAYDQRDYWTCYGWLFIAGTLLRLASLSMLVANVDKSKSPLRALKRNASRLIPSATLARAWSRSASFVR